MSLKPSPRREASYNDNYISAGTDIEYDLFRKIKLSLP